MNQQKLYIGNKGEPITARLAKAAENGFDLKFLFNLKPRLRLKLVLKSAAFGYYGLICATDFGGSVPVISVQTVPNFTV